MLCGFLRLPSTISVDVFMKYYRFGIYRLGPDVKVGLSLLFAIAEVWSRVVYIIRSESLRGRRQSGRAVRSRDTRQLRLVRHAFATIAGRLLLRVRGPTGARAIGPVPAARVAGVRQLSERGQMDG